MAPSIDYEGSVLSSGQEDTFQPFTKASEIKSSGIGKDSSDFDYEESKSKLLISLDNIHDIMTSMNESGRDINNLDDIGVLRDFIEGADEPVVDAVVRGTMYGYLGETMGEGPTHVFAFPVMKNEDGGFVFKVLKVDGVEATYFDTNIVDNKNLSPTEKILEASKEVRKGVESYSLKNVNEVLEDFNRSASTIVEASKVDLFDLYGKIKVDDLNESFNAALDSDSADQDPFQNLRT